VLESQRHQVILNFLSDKGFASVPDLSNHLKSSEATIRRDLVKLSEQKKIKKIRGGAQTIESDEKKKSKRSLLGSNFAVDIGLHAKTKRAIAEKAVSICEDNEAIIINGGSSTFMMGQYLVKRPISVLTNSFYLANDLIAHGDNQVTLAGGEVYRQQGIVLSSFENDSLQYYRGTKMFMGTPGIGEFGVMESDPLLVRSEQKLLKQADKLVVLADSSKLGKRSNFIFAALDAVDIIITDSGSDKNYIALFQDKGIEVLIVDKID